MEGNEGFPPESSNTEYVTEIVCVHGWGELAFRTVTLEERIDFPFFVNYNPYANWKPLWLVFKIESFMQG